MSRRTCVSQGGSLTRRLRVESAVRDSSRYHATSSLAGHALDNALAPCTSSEPQAESDSNLIRTVPESGMANQRMAKREGSFFNHIPRALGWDERASAFLRREE